MGVVNKRKSNLYLKIFFNLNLKENDQKFLKQVSMYGKEVDVKYVCDKDG